MTGAASRMNERPACDARALFWEWVNRFYSRAGRSARRNSPRRSGGFPAKKRRHGRGRTLASRRLLDGRRGERRRRRLVRLREEVGERLALRAALLVLLRLVLPRLVFLRLVLLRLVLLR